MTWDVYALRAPGVRSVEALPEGYEPPAVGPFDEVLALVREALPDVDASNESWLTLRRPGFSLEIGLGKSVSVHDVYFYVTVEDEDAHSAVSAVLDVCRALRITPYDTETGEVLTTESGPPAYRPPTPDEDEDEPRGLRRLFGRRKG
ncbi:hypothetical protein CLV35_2896 [Motilibacter peucedani]|uniref:Uncharacterized protein n=1 Tax=Motilibacter peucedani TaxID=598650 RepID=A0A420XMZ2_9ACTN|nr:hypothetical protein [Motilibacter peucedani]RKS72648.1 hypothetical protein CLV35_2896 [Motilibacter peucedani]